MARNISSHPPQSAALPLLLLACIVGSSLAAAGGESEAPANSSGSRNMQAACYADSVSGACKEFQRADEDWLDDLDQACADKPYLAGCSLYRQCQNGTASGTYCTLSSLAANVCTEAPGEPGCEAYVALCTGGTKVRLCSIPGPVPSRTTAERAKAAIESLCAQSCLDGCKDCGPGTGWDTCTEPLLTVAWMCRTGYMLPQCSAGEGAGYDEMCINSGTVASFPLTCSDPPRPASEC